MRADCDDTHADGADHARLHVLRAQLHIVAGHRADHDHYRYDDLVPAARLVRCIPPHTADYGASSAQRKDPDGAPDRVLKHQDEHEPDPHPAAVIEPQRPFRHERRPRTQHHPDRQLKRIQHILAAGRPL